MTTFTDWINALDSFVWGPAMLVLILGTGLYLQVRLGGMPVRKIGAGLRLVWRGRGGDEAHGEVSPYSALMTCLAATIGVGNIAGVATAVALGGPGAVFWMWMTALVGMATKYAEVLLAVHFRERDAKGRFVGGPMYAIRNGLGPRWAWLGATFALFGGLAGFGIGNMVQSNSIAAAMQGSFNITPLVTGVVLSVVTGAVILGGIKRIAAVANWLVPFMAIGYMIAAMIVLVYHWQSIPDAFALIFETAFTGTAAVGGFAGAAMMAAIRYGVARGIFSNEAGLGTAGIAQAAGMSNDPVRSGLIGMMGTFLDTLVVCTMTGLAGLPGARDHDRKTRSSRRCPVSAANSSQSRWVFSRSRPSSAGRTTESAAGSTWWATGRSCRTASCGRSWCSSGQSRTSTSRGPLPTRSTR